MSCAPASIEAMRMMLTQPSTATSARTIAKPPSSFAAIGIRLFPIVVSLAFLHTLTV